MLFAWVLDKAPVGEVLNNKIGNAGDYGESMVVKPVDVVAEPFFVIFEVIYVLEALPRWEGVVSISNSAPFRSRRGDDSRNESIDYVLDKT